MIKKIKEEMPIDFVITWVDGNDPKWRAERKKYSDIDHSGDQREIRYRDWDLLRYWFRGVELYAPWVNKIYFVTWGHVPKWLNVSHPKLKVVRHTDYIPQQYLPTFNSHTIELNLHRIGELSEQFVYFNDDMFVVAPVQEKDFFRNGMPVDTFALNTIFFDKDSIGPINGNNVSVINDNFDKFNTLKKYWYKWFSPANGIKNIIKTSLLLPWSWFPGFMYTHTSTNLKKHTFEEVWENAYEILDKTCEDRFRNPTNVNQWLFKYWQLAQGNFIPSSNKRMTCFHIKDSTDKACTSILNGKYKIICINDTGKTQNFEKASKEIREAFEKKFPNKSEFEL